MNGGGQGKSLVRILRDDARQYMCIIKNGELLHEGTFESVIGEEALAETLRALGYAVIEEGYDSK